MASPPTKQNTAASVVTFFPDEDLAARLDVLTTQCSALVIVDNSTNIAARKLVAEAAAEAGANSIANNANLGVAAALNQAARWAESQQLEWLLTIDQDSTPFVNTLDLLARAWSACPYRDRVAVIGSNVEGAAADPGAEFKPAITTITSGSLIRIEAWKDAGGFRDDLFIDGVDEEFCLRLQRAGYKIIETVRPAIAHKVGAPSHHRVLGRDMSVTNHPPFRRYYMTRNRLRLAIDYFADQPRWLARYFFYTLKEYARMLLFERSRRQKIYAVMLGARDALTNKMGPLRNKYLIHTDDADSQ